MLRVLFLFTYFMSEAFSADSIMFAERKSTFQVKSVLSPYNPDSLSPVATYGLNEFTPETGGCNKISIMLTKRQEENIYELSSPLDNYNCSQIVKVRKSKELTPDTCMSLASCFKNKINLSFSVTMKAKENAAAEAVSLMASTTINQLTELEELKAYAEVKYGAEFIPESCREDQFKIPEKNNTSMCMTKVIDRGFELSQKICALAEKGCHSDYLEYTNGKETVNGSTSLMANFLKSKTHGHSKKLISEDSSTTKAIAKIMMDASKSPEARAEAIQEYFQSNYQRLDPIYKFYSNQFRQSNSENSRNEVKEGFIKYINSNSGRSPEEIVVELDMLRKKEAKKRLGESCGNVISMPKLCQFVTDVLNGSEVQVPENKFDRLMKNQYTSILGPKSEVEEIAENVARCNTFSVAKTIGKNVIDKTRLSGGFNLFSSGITGSFFMKEVNIGGITSGLYGEDTRPILILNDAGEISKRQFYGSKETEQITSSKESALDTTVLVTKFSKNEVMKDPAPIESRVVPAHNDKNVITEIKTPVISDEASKIATKHSEPSNTAQNLAQQQNQANSRNFISGGARSQEIIIDDTASPSKVLPEKQTQASGYSQLMNKISGLEEKIAAAKKKSVVENSAAATGPAGESSLARELRLEAAKLAELKASGALNDSEENRVNTANFKKNKKVIATKLNDDNDEEEVVSPISSPAVKDTRKGASVQSAASAGSTSAARNSASIEVASTSSRTSSGTAGDFAGAGAVVLTGLDGAGSSKISESINKMIFAEAGKPFYIEEGGYVKEIIPVIVDGEIVKGEDGAPIYKTVIKGKVGEFKIDSKGLKNKKDQVAKSTSPADVKRSDEERTSATVIRYREFQGIFKPKK